MVAHTHDTQGKCPACRAVYRWQGRPLLRDALCPRHQTPLRRTTNRRDWPVLRAQPGVHECGPLCPEHGDARDTSMDLPCSKCGHRAHGGPCPVDAEDDATERCSCELAVAR